MDDKTTDNKTGNTIGTATDTGTGTPEHTAAAPASEPAPPGAGADGPAGETQRPDPTRYGDWEKNGRCIDF